jgi:hypothetical protein
MIVPAGTFGAVAPICAFAPVTEQAANANITKIRFIIFVLQSIFRITAHMPQGRDKPTRFIPSPA